MVFLKNQRNQTFGDVIGRHRGAGREPAKRFRMRDVHIGPLGQRDAPLNLYSVAVNSIIRVSGG